MPLRPVQGGGERSSESEEEMSVIQMTDGKRFVVSESAEGVMEILTKAKPARGQGRPLRPGEETGPTFARFTSLDRTPIYLNTDLIVSVTEEEE